MHRLRILFDRMIFMYFFVGIIPLLIILSLFLHFSTDQFSEKIKETFSLQTENYISITNTEVNSLLHQAYAIAVDDELVNIIRGFNSKNNPQYSASLFRSHTASIRSLNSDLSDFIYIDMDGEYMISQRSPSIESRAYWEDANIRKRIIKRLNASNRIQYITAENDSDSSIPISFYLGIPITTSPKSTTSGILLIAVNNRFFSNIPRNIQNDDLTQPMHNLIIDDDNLIVFCDDQDFCGQRLGKYLAHNKISEDNYTLIKNEISQSTWTHHSYLPQNMQFTSLVAFQRVLYIMLLVLCAMVFILISSVVVAQNIRIRHIAQSIVNFSGEERDYRIEAHTNSILQEVIESFNAMTTRVQELVGQLKQKERDIADSLNRQRIAEIKTMEAQINPHFLSNTLNTISWAAIEKGELEISDMICSIAHLMQYSIRNVDLPVYVSEEVDWLKDYLFLQKKRFATLFNYTITVKDGLDECMIHKLLLQPLLENSILHAFDEPSPKNHIGVAIEPLLLSNQIQITVTDNGHGIPEKALIQLRQDMAELIEAPGSHIGLLNTCNRMRAYYGNSASIDIHSDTLGTKIILTLPMIFQNNTEGDLI